MVVSSPQQTLDLEKPEKLRGDWVLFHPVYTPEELKAVQVRFAVVIHLPNECSIFRNRSFTETQIIWGIVLPVASLNLPDRYSISCQGISMSKVL